MAKLSAHGREILRLEQERTIPDSEDRLCNWERKTRAYMADGKIMEKWDVRFRPDSLDLANGRPDGRPHTYGWKIAGKLKAGFSMDEHAARVLRVLAIAPERAKWRIVTPAAIYARLLTIQLPAKPETQTTLTLTAETAATL
jgi:hypothetical protein